jgi:antitoxin VapB
MSLNIKKARVHELAREAARVTGKTQTGAIEEALERLLAAYDADPGDARVRARMDLVTGLVAEYAGDPGDADRGVRRVEDLYDDTTGLPR